MEALVAHDIHALGIWLGVAALVTVCLAVLTTTQTRLALAFSGRLSMVIREDLLRRLLQASFSQVLTRDLGGTYNRFEGDVEGFTSALVSIVPVVTAVISFCMLMIVMPITEWHLTIVALPFMPLWLMTFLPLRKKIVAAGEKLSLARDHFVTRITEVISLSGVIRIKTFSSCERERELVRSDYVRLLNLRIAQFDASRLTGIAQSALMAFSSAAVMLTGIVLMQRGVTTLGVIITFSAYFSKLFGPIGQLAAVGSQLSTVEYNARRITDLLDMDAEVDNGTEVPATASLQLNGVTYAYGNVPVLRDVSFDLPAGDWMLIRGPSGCGKSTLLRLMVALVRPARGSLLLGGVDILDIPLAELRRRVMYLPQEASIFFGTLKANICYGAGVLSTEETVARAIRTAALEEFIDGLPQGLDTVLDAQAAPVSGGQKARIVLARALVAEPDILLLDETLSALDPVTEHRVIDGLRMQYPKISVVVVSHKLATTLDFSRVLDLSGAVSNDIVAASALETAAGI